MTVRSWNISLNRCLPFVISGSNQLLRVDTINYGSLSAFQHWCTLVGSKFILRKTEAFLLGDRSSFVYCVRRNSRFCKTAGWTVQVKFKHDLSRTIVNWWSSNAIRDAVYAWLSDVRGCILCYDLDRSHSLHVFAFIVALKSDLAWEWSAQNTHFLHTVAYVFHIFSYIQMVFHQLIQCNDSLWRRVYRALAPLQKDPITK